MGKQFEENNLNIVLNRYYHFKSQVFIRVDLPSIKCRVVVL